MAKVALIYNLKRSKSKKYAGDYFSEFDSPQTIEAIAAAIRLAGHDLFLVEADKELFHWLEVHRIDIAFNVAEGFCGPSRESQIPAILDFLGIPYSGSGVLALALSLDKAKAKQIFMHYGIPTPKFQLLQSENELLQELCFPVIVKPNCEGSAKGIHCSNVVKDKVSCLEQIAKVRKQYRQEVIVEEFIEGKELTVAILGNGDNLQILPVLEIDFSNCRKKGESFYSWEVKEYQGIDPLYPDPEFFCPARISKTKAEQLCKISLQAHRALGCLDISRVDIRLSEKDELPYILEVNPLPGLDPQESNVTKMAQAAGINYQALINNILENALSRHQFSKDANYICG